MHTAHIIAVITLTFLGWILNLATDCFKTCRENFLRCSAHIYDEKVRGFFALLGVRRDSYDETDNLLVLPRIFKELGMVTRDSKFKWDANAKRDDGIQYGWHRIPSKSFFLQLCAYLEITHYIHMPYRGKHIEVVGPVEGCKLLIDLSKEGATRKLTDEQKDSLREAFGLDPFVSKADLICQRYDKLILLTCGVVGLGCCGLFLKSKVEGMCWFVLCVVAGVCYSRCSSHFQLDRATTQTDLDKEDGLEVGFLSNTYNEADEIIDNRVSQPDVDTQLQQIIENVETESNILSRDRVQVQCRQFNSMFCDHRHYHTGMLMSIPVSLKEPLFIFKQAPQAYIVPLAECFKLSVAQRVQFDERDALHILVYNPMTDPYLFSARTVFEAGVDLRNLLIVIFPPLENLEVEIFHKFRQRVMLRDDAQFVTTPVDLEKLLLEMSSGVATFPELIFILPTSQKWSQELVHDNSNVWKAFQTILRPHNCHGVKESLEVFDNV